jgi:D-amino-acid dehydrogenase
MASAPIMVVGSGLAGAAAAWALGRAGLSVTLIEDRESGDAAPPEEERYCSWWPGIDDAMAPVASRGVDLLEQLYALSEGGFGGDRRGHLFLAHHTATDDALRILAGRQAPYSGFQLREHATAEWYLPSPTHGMKGVPDGLDFLEGRGLRTAFPFLGGRVRSGLHVRRAGTVDGRALRRWLLGVVRLEGGTTLTGHVIGADRRGPDDWVIRLADGGTTAGRAIILAGGRSARGLIRQLGVPDPAAAATWVVARLEDRATALPPAAPVVVPSDEPFAADPVVERSGSFFSLRGGRRDLVIEATTAAAGLQPPLAAGDLVRGLADSVPAVAADREQPSRLTSVAVRIGLALDGRPVVGLWRDGLHLLTGVTGGVGVVLGAAEALADSVSGRRSLEWTAALTPARGLPPAVPRYGLPDIARVDFSPRVS